MLTPSVVHVPPSAEYCAAIWVSLVGVGRHHEVALGSYCYGGLVKNSTDRLVAQWLTVSV